MARFRQLKKDMAAALARDDWRKSLASMHIDPDTQVNPLLALRLHPIELVCWRAVEALGSAVAELAETRMERARVHMRTFMWFMNEESGNLGWGIPEAMATAMAQNERLAREYHTIVASYVYCGEDCDGNYLDHPELRRGVFWGLGRLAETRPETVTHALRFLVTALKDADGPNRGLAARAIGILAAKGETVSPEAAAALTALTDDHAPVRVYRSGTIEATTVAALAEEALGSVA